MSVSSVAMERRIRDLQRIVKPNAGVETIDAKCTELQRERPLESRDIGRDQICRPGNQGPVERARARHGENTTVAEFERLAPIEQGPVCFRRQAWNRQVVPASRWKVGWKFAAACAARPG